MTNKSELYNPLSYRGLSYFLKAGSQTFINDYKFLRLYLKIQHQMPFDLNSLKIGSTFFFENSLKSMQIFQTLIGGINLRERSQKNQTSSAVGSEKRGFFPKIVLP